MKPWIQTLEALIPQTPFLQMHRLTLWNHCVMLISWKRRYGQQWTCGMPSWVYCVTPDLFWDIHQCYISMLYPHPLPEPLCVLPSSYYPHSGPNQLGGRGRQSRPPKVIFNTVRTTALYIHDARPKFPRNLWSQEVVRNNLRSLLQLYSFGQEHDPPQWVGRGPETMAKKRLSGVQTRAQTTEWRQTGCKLIGGLFKPIRRIGHSLMSSHWTPQSQSHRTEADRMRTLQDCNCNRWNRLPVSHTFWADIIYLHITSHIFPWCPSTVLWHSTVHRCSGREFICKRNKTCCLHTACVIRFLCFDIAWNRSSGNSPRAGRRWPHASCDLAEVWPGQDRQGLAYTHRPACAVGNRLSGCHAAMFQATWSLL